MKLSEALLEQKRTLQPGLPISSGDLDEFLDTMDAGTADGDWRPYGHEPGQDRLRMRPVGQGVYDVHDNWTLDGAVVGQLEHVGDARWGRSWRGRIAAGQPGAGTRVEGETRGQALSEMERRLDGLD